MTAILRQDEPLEQRIARNWSNQDIAQALAEISPGCLRSKRWTPAMKRAIRAEAQRRLALGDDQ